MTNPFRGLGVAIITPFDEYGQVDYKQLARVTEDIINNGADFLCVLGTTAETPTLSPEEKLKIMHIIEDTNAGRLPLMLGAGKNCTEDVCRYLRNTDLSAYQGVLIVTPYYNKPSQEGLYQHYKSISEASPLPLVMYNVPGRTGVNLEPETIKRIVNDCSNVIAIKEASGDIEQARRIIKLTEGFDFELICGDDKLTRTLMDMGATGVISVIGNVFTPEFKSVVEGHAFTPYLEEMTRLSMADGNPAGIKAIMHECGKLEHAGLRLPLVPVCEEVAKDIREAKKLLS